MGKIIRPDVRIVYEHIREFLPYGESTFVVYDKSKDAFYCNSRSYKIDFELDCVWSHTLDVLTIDVILLTELFNYSYVANKLDVLALLEYTSESETIDFLNPLFDGEDDYITITDMAINQ